MQIDESDEQPQKAEPSIHESLEAKPNSIVERDLHPQKQLSPSFVTEEGTQIDESDRQLRNAKTPIAESRESNSNITSVKVRQLAKHITSSVSTLFGIVTIESVPEYHLIEMRLLSIRKCSETLK
jgi:hypothetical protein